MYAIEMAAQITMNTAQITGENNTGTHQEGSFVLIDIYYNYNCL